MNIMTIVWKINVDSYIELIIIFMNAYLVLISLFLFSNCVRNLSSVFLRLTKMGDVFSENSPGHSSYPRLLIPDTSDL